MSDFQRLLDAIPDDSNVAFILADYLEERDDPRCELLRLSYTLKDLPDITPDRLAMEQRLRELILVEKVEPVVPKVTNAIGMEFAWVPPGTFWMGSPESEEGREDNETQQLVTLTKGLYVGTTPVTQRHWQSVMGNNPSYFSGDDSLPVESVSWDDCQEFVEALNASEQARLKFSADRAGKFGLLTEAQWEYSCRSGTTTAFWFGETISTAQANYDGGEVYGKGKEGEYREQTTRVGSFPPNAWSLYDMHGNVWEWCQDMYGPYSTAGIRDPQIAQKRSSRVLRGGSWFNNPAICRSAFRNRYFPDYRNNRSGCRVAFCLD